MNNKKRFRIYTLFALLFGNLTFINSCKKEDDLKINQPELKTNTAVLKPYMIGHLEGINIQFDQKEYTAYFGDSGIRLFTLDASTLTFVTPAVKEGYYTLRVGIDGEEFNVGYTVMEIQDVADPDNYLEQLKKEFNAGIDSTIMMMDSAKAAGAIFDEAEKNELKELSTKFNATLLEATKLSVEERKRLAGVLSVNLSAFTKAFEYTNQLQGQLSSFKLKKKSQTCSELPTRAEQIKCLMDAYHYAFEEGYTRNRIHSALLFLYDQAGLFPGVIGDIVSKVLDHKNEKFNRVMYLQGTAIASKPYRALRLNTFSPPLLFQNNQYETISVKVLMGSVNENPSLSDLDWEKRFSKEFGKIVNFNVFKDLGWGEVWEFVKAEYEFPRQFPQQTEQWLIPELKSKLEAISRTPYVYDKNVIRDENNQNIKIRFTTTKAGASTNFNYQMRYEDPFFSAESEEVSNASINGIEPVRLVYISGDNQVGNYDEWLKDPIRVKVLDAEGNGMTNVSVFFKRKDATSFMGGVVKSGEVKTQDGFAETQWKLGYKDEQELEVTVYNGAGELIIGSPLIIHAKRALCGNLKLSVSLTGKILKAHANGGKAPYQFKVRRLFSSISAEYFSTDSVFDITYATEYQIILKDANNCFDSSAWILMDDIVIDAVKPTDHGIADVIYSSKLGLLHILEENPNAKYPIQVVLTGTSDPDYSIKTLPQSCCEKPYCLDQKWTYFPIRALSGGNPYLSGRKFSIVFSKEIIDGAFYSIRIYNPNAASVTCLFAKWSREFTLVWNQ